MSSKKATSKNTKKKEKPTLKTATKETKIGAAEKPKKITPAKIGKDGYLDKAIMADSKAIDYICPNNREDRNDSDGHYFVHHCSQVYTKKEHPICSFCKTKTVMIDYDKEEKEDVGKNKKVS
jgi:hypothetical protein